VLTAWPIVIGVIVAAVVVVVVLVCVVRKFCCNKKASTPPAKAFDQVTTFVRAFDSKSFDVQIRWLKTKLSKTFFVAKSFPEMRCHE
jgi:hypothetical protein